MSCKLFAGDSPEAPQPQPMPWSTAGSPAPRVQHAAVPPAAQRFAAPGGHEDTQAAFVEQRVREAREAGRAEGEGQGRRAVQGELESTLHKLASSIHEASELRSRLRAQAEADLVRLAIAIARRIVGRELNADPEAITGLVKAALERVRAQEVLRVRIHPSHSACIADCLSRFGASHAEVVADPAAEPGAVVFETSRGSFDASVETQLREIERGLTDRFRGTGAL